MIWLCLFWVAAAGAMMLGILLIISAIAERLVKLQVEGIEARDRARMMREVRQFADWQKRERKRRGE
jgi:hypothetical protein